MKVCEIFHSVQGEIDVGVPMIFIRLSGCNMKPKCKFCDTSYSWNDGKEMSLYEIKEKIKKYDCRNICFTGGEPSLQIDEIEELIMMLQFENSYKFYLETNGTFFLSHKQINLFEKISCSPKKQKIDEVCLIRFGVFGHCRFKFVYENKKDLWWEKVIEDCMIGKNNVYIMSEGKTREQQLSRMKEVVEYCKQKQFNFTPRLHTLVWGSKKGV